jgi:hypothetical protein
MANIINGDNGVVSGSAGLKSSADSTGVLALQTNGTTAVSISTGQVVTLTNALAVTSGGTGVTTSTGSGANVLGTSPTLTTPTINSAQIPTVSGTAPLYMCRAWINFNGTGTPAIRGSGNVSSITDNGTGNYTVNFTTAMPDTTYSAVGTCGSPSVAHGVVMFVVGTGTITGTGGVQFATTSLAAAQFDYVFVCLSVFR